MTIRTELLVISGSPGVNFPPWSTRRAVQSLIPIPASVQLRRTVNGSLKDLSNPDFQKFISTISCADVQPPDFGNAWPGALVTVDCIQELSYLTSGGSAQRTVVPGSSRVEGDFTFFRPRLTMRIVNFSMEEDEWAAGVSWSLDLEEV